MAAVPPDNLQTFHDGAPDFRALVETASDGIAVLSKDGVFQYINPSYQRLLGYEPAELAGRPIHPLLHPDDRQSFTETFADVLAHPGQTRRAEVRLRHKAGAWRIIETDFRLLPGGEVASASHDVTERKQADEALRLAETKYRQLVERVPAIVYTAEVGPDSPWLYVSPQVESLLGFTPEEWIDDPALWMNRMHPDDRASVLAKEARYKSNPTPQTNLDEYRFITRDGREVWIHDEGIIYWDEIHQRHLWHGVFTDITEYKRTQAELELSADILKSINDFIIVGDAQGQIVYVNPAVKTLLGYEPADILGEGWWHLERPDPASLAQERRYIEQAARGEVSVNSQPYEHQFKRRDGSICWLTMRDAKGPRDLVIGVGHDITERKRAEAALRESEARTRLILDAALDAVITIDANGLITGWNPQAESIFGWSRAQALGRRLSETIIPPEHRADHEQGLRRYLQTGEGPVLNQRIEITALRRNGEVFPVELAITPLDTPPTVTFSAFVRDITRRKQAEDDLRRLNAELDERVTQRTAELTEANRRLQEEISARSRLAEIIEATSDAVGTSDIYGNLQYLNHAARQLLGIGQDAAIAGMLLADVFSPEVIDYVVTEAIPTAVEEGTFSFETLMRHAEGRDIPVWLVGIAHKAPDGTPVSLTGVARDITERKQAEAELKGAKETAEAATRAKSTFLASMSHEIRTPMNAVIGMTSLLLNTPLNSKQREYVETVRAAGDSLLTIINDILDFSKIEAGRLDLENQPIDVRACVEVRARPAGPARRREKPRTRLLDGWLSA